MKFIHDVTNIQGFDFNNYNNTSGIRQSTIRHIESARKRTSPSRNCISSIFYLTIHLLNGLLNIKTNNIFTIMPRLTTADRARAAGLLHIRITLSCKVYPLTSHFYIVKLGFTGVYDFSYFCSKT